MNSRDRVNNCLNYRGYDRIPVFYKATPEFDRYFKGYINGKFEVDFDFRNVEPLYTGPELKVYEDGSKEGLFGERYKIISNAYGKYDEATYLPFADITSLDELKNYRFPSADWYDYSEIKNSCIKNKGYSIVYGGGGRMDFINGIARCRGVEQVLLDIATEDPIYLELMRKRHEFYYEVLERVLKASEGLIDIIYIGEDYGSQNGLLISPEKFEKMFKPFLKQYIDLAHKYNAKAMLHSCGSVRKLIPKFIKLGLDILDVVQVEACGMDIQELHKEYYRDIVFHGSMSVQSLLPFGTVEEIRRQVELRLKLFKDGGLLLGPTHSIQPDTSPNNVLEMYKAANCVIPENGLERIWTSVKEEYRNV